MVTAGHDVTITFSLEQVGSRFDSIERARAFCQGFFAWCNHAHRHSGIGYMTLAAVHTGQAPLFYAARQQVLAISRSSRIPNASRAVIRHHPLCQGCAGTKTRFRKVASLGIPAQRFDSDAQMQFAENLSFNPWLRGRAPPTAGGINRARKVIYAALSEFRHDHNGIPQREPTGDESFPID